jgi:hypothetical protein
MGYAGCIEAQFAMLYAFTAMRKALHALATDGRTAWIRPNTSPPDKRSRTSLVSMNTMASRKAPSNRAGRREDIRGTMAMALPEYELYAIRYAMRDAQRRDHFIGGDPHDAPMPMDYFVWVAKRKERTVVIDIGFTEEVAAKRGRTFLRCPIKAGTDRSRGGGGERRGADASALRPLRQSWPLPGGALPLARVGDPLRDRPLHGLSETVAFLRGGGRLRCRPAQLQAAHQVLQRRRRARVGHRAVCRQPPPRVAQAMPTAPAASCRRAMDGDLWVLACGRSAILWAAAVCANRSASRRTHRKSSRPFRPSCGLA